jgi:ribosomal-protein-alanine N-acetyltransferase
MTIGGTSGSPVLIEAHMAHAGVLAALHEIKFAEPWPAQSFMDLLGQATVRGWIATAANPAGFILVRIAANEAAILTLAVAIGQRRQGFGRYLVDHAMAAIGQAGAKTCHLEVALDNNAAQALYTGMGFAVTGHRKNYYARANGTVDAVLMARHLD